MQTDRAGIADFMEQMMLSRRAQHDHVGIYGWGWAELRAESGALKQLVFFENLVTQVGDQYYGERAAGIASPPGQVTGMRLGTGSTAVAKTGAGAAIVTYTTASQVAIAGSFPTSSIPGSARRIQWQSLWGAGVATADRKSVV